MDDKRTAGEPDQPVRLESIENHRNRLGGCSGEICYVLSRKRFFDGHGPGACTIKVLTVAGKEIDDSSRCVFENQVADLLFVFFKPVIEPLRKMEMESGDTRKKHLEFGSAHHTDGNIVGCFCEFVRDVIPVEGKLAEDLSGIEKVHCFRVSILIEPGELDVSFADCTRGVDGVSHDVVWETDDQAAQPGAR